MGNLHIFIQAPWFSSLHITQPMFPVWSGNSGWRASPWNMPLPIPIYLSFIKNFKGLTLKKIIVLSWFSLLHQAIISSESQLSIPVWQVEDQLMHESLMEFPKVHSALFPVTSGSCGIECQDVSVYRLLQVCSWCGNFSNWKQFIFLLCTILK